MARPKPKKAQGFALSVRDPVWAATHPGAIAAHPGWARTHPRAVASARTKLGQIRQDRNPLYNPLGQLSGHTLAGAAKQLADAQVDPTVAALGREIGTAQGVGAAQSRRAEDYYRMLNQDTQAGADKQRQIEASTNETLKGIGAETAQRVDQSGQQAMEASAQDAAVRGPSTGNDALVSELAAQRAAVARDAQTFRSTGAIQGAGWSGLGQATHGAGVLKGGETQRSILGQTQKAVTELSGKRADAEAQRGPLTMKALQDLRQSEFEKFATVKGLGIKEADLQLNAALGQQKIATTKRGQDITARGQNISAATQRRGQNITARGQDIASRDRALAREQQRHQADAKWNDKFRASFKDSFNRSWGMLTTHQVKVPSAASLQPVAYYRTHPQFVIGQLIAKGWQPEGARAAYRAWLRSNPRDRPVATGRGNVAS